MTSSQAETSLDVSGVERLSRQFADVFVTEHETGHAVTSLRATRTRLAVAAMPVYTTAVSTARPMPSSAVPPRISEASTWPGKYR